MAKLHTHYIINTQKELKYAYAGVLEDVFQSSIREALSNTKVHDDLSKDGDENKDFFDDDDDDDDDDNDDDDDDDDGNERIMIQTLLIKEI
jgi:hypothetical protein